MPSVKERVRVIEEKLWRLNPNLRLKKTVQGYQVLKLLENSSGWTTVSPTLTLKEMEIWVSAYMKGWAEAWRTAKHLLEKNKKEEFKWMLQNQGLR